MPTPDDFRRIALGFPGAEEGSHMGHADFRVGGRIFATLGSPDEAWGMAALMPEQQEDFTTLAPEAFKPAAGAWGAAGALGSGWSRGRRICSKRRWRRRGSAGRMPGAGTCLAAAAGPRAAAGRGPILRPLPCATRIDQPNPQRYRPVIGQSDSPCSSRV